MGMGEKLFCNAVQPFVRLKLSNEEFVLIRAIIYSHMVSPGLSDQAQKLLYFEAEKYSALLMSFLQTNYGPAAGAIRYVELMGLIECLFNTGAKHRQLNTYVSNVLDPNFDKNLVLGYAGKQRRSAIGKCNRKDGREQMHWHRFVIQARLKT
ncbi:hypothetical protein niasHS_000058 [Heterodera schachtii]|uniref:NR LBD domain-containing protein n=1 Tax=Heterodera schachtii TaxID=97005 RepID=A0ABD2KN94_HETSC